MDKGTELVRLEGHTEHVKNVAVTAEGQVISAATRENVRLWQLPKLDALLTRNRRAFVVVGAAHLVGPDGLLAMFRAKGYKVDQL